MIKIYDQKLKKKVPFVPLNEGEVRMYVCGPTVYDVAHLGHGRSAVSFDVIRRYFESKDFKVKFVSNYTDIDDKMINRAKDEGISVSDLAAKIIPEYEKDYAALGIKKPDVTPRATDEKYIAAMIDIIKRLELKGYTYLLPDGVYFDVAKYKDYGNFSGQNLEDLKAGARVEVDERKQNSYDFVLWKFKKEGEPSWASPWGEGRPGWHIECSAMSYVELSENFDIHGGGLDLKFPHHECEVAQSKGAFGKDAFARYWLHNGFIQVNNEKMSKSLGNFSTLKDIFEKYDPQVVRLMFLQTHYRNPINFSSELLEQAKSSLGRIHDFVRSFKNNYEDLSPGAAQTPWGVKYLADFEEAMDNDFDTSGALACVFGLISQINSLRTMPDAALNKMEIDSAEAALKQMDSVLKIIYPPEGGQIPAEIVKLAEKRRKAREDKDFEAADKLRQEITEKGFLIEDNVEGYILKKL